MDIRSYLSDIHEHCRTAEASLVIRTTYGEKGHVSVCQAQAVASSLSSAGSDSPVI